METKSFVHYGFTFQVEGGVLPALALSHLPGKDLRTAERLLDRFFLDLLMMAQSTFGARFQQMQEPPEFVVQADGFLSSQLQKALSEVTCWTYLVSSIPGIEALVRRLLPYKQINLQVVKTLEGLHQLPPGGLVLIDAFNHDGKDSLPSLEGLDHLVVRFLVDSRRSLMVEPWLQDLIIPIKCQAKAGITTRQTAARNLLDKAMEAALFSRYFARCQASHLR